MERLQPAADIARKAGLNPASRGHGYLLSVFAHERKREARAADAAAAVLAEAHDHARELEAAIRDRDAQIAELQAAVALERQASAEVQALCKILKADISTHVQARRDAAAVLEKVKAKWPKTSSVHADLAIHYLKAP